ncbi:acetyl-lysine deacetylase [Halalkalicoccus paucihalophilus]|uniref:Acetyl-lysine deacetylase n=1 Tax=Halalkalicoccus paucihalophilus TaxID=1008153 RepID=A0A151AJR0_9EURY|nr:M20 family metallopeptidase [Halalkalicoccus paucihalophilus]KYH27647.1 acetyl-lysine deacetylase [Halalkalicoccus paucihalophilus]
MSFDPIEFLERAVEIPSNEGVEEMRDLLCETLAEHGVEPRVDGAGNVIASRGEGSPHTLLNTHIDTVSPHVPFESDGDVIRGRGSCDAKGPLAAMLAAFLDCDPDGTLTLAVTPDEETLSTGAHALALDFDRCIVGEPTDTDICTAAKGRFQGTLTVRGENAHAAEPETGHNAVSDAGRVLLALEEFDADAEPHPDLGGPTLTPTMIEGGSATNQVPSECRITLDRRSVPPETTEAFAETLVAHLESRVPEIEADFRFTERETPFLEAFETDPNAAVVEALRAAGAGKVRPFTAATEASYFANEAPTVVFGPGVLADERGAVAHGEREYVRVTDVRRAARILTEALSRPT